jgi:hypothetical protein
MEDVPAGWVALGKVATRTDGTQDRTLHKALCDAHARGHIQAVKFFRSADDWKTGPVFLEPHDAEKFVAEWKAAREPKPVPTVVAPPAIPVDELSDAIKELRLAIKSLAYDVRNLQAAMELRAESESPVPA